MKKKQNKEQQETYWRENLFEEFKKLVPFHAHKIAKTIGYNNLDFEDLCSAGYESLWEAILKYQSARSSTFKNYISLRIRGGMLDYLRKNSPCCSAAYSLYRKIKKIMATESASTAESLGTEGISAFLFEYLSDINHYCRTVNSTPEEQAHRKEKYREILQMISKLPDNQQLVIYEHYINDKSFIEIAHENPGLSKSWLARLHKTALNKLKYYYQNQQEHALSVNF